MIHEGGELRFENATKLLAAAGRACEYEATRVQERRSKILR